MTFHDLEGTASESCDSAERRTEAEAQARTNGTNVLRASWSTPDYEQLRSEAYVIRPDWIVWTRPVPDGAETLLHAQSRRQRNRTRLARRALSACELALDDPITQPTYDRWLLLYRTHIAEMTNGVDVASRLRDSILAARDHFLATWWDGNGELISGMVAQRDARWDVLRIRFSAVRSPAPARELLRAMCMAMADMARSYGLSMLSLGIDMNFFGAILMPGLCFYKLRLGMVAVPASALGDAEAGLVADKVLSLERLTEPVLCFEQEAPMSVAAQDPMEAGRRLRLAAFVSEDFDVGAVTELARVDVRVVGAG